MKRSKEHKMDNLPQAMKAFRCIAKEGMVPKGYSEGAVILITNHELQTRISPVWLKDNFERVPWLDEFPPNVGRMHIVKVYKPTGKRKG